MEHESGPEITPQRVGEHAQHERREEAAQASHGSDQLPVTVPVAAGKYLGTSAKTARCRMCRGGASARAAPANGTMDGQARRSA